MKRWILTFFLLFTCLMTGCAAQKEESTDAMLEDELIRIGDNSCTLAEAMIFVAAQKNIYQDSYGGDIWSVKLSEGTFETYIMNGLKTYLGKLFSAAQMAGNEGYTLTDEEAAKVNQAAAAYMAAMSEDEIAATHLNEEIVRDAYEQYVLARKLYDHVLADANVEVSSDEARVIHLQKLLYATQDLSETELQEKEAAAKQAAAGIAEGKDFAAVSGDGVITELEVMRGQLDPDVETAVFALATGEVSPVLDTDEGYVIYKCTDSYDEAASNANKTKLLAEHRDQVFNEYLDSYLKEHQALFNDQAWEKLSISGYQGAASANFYTIYQQYFSEQQ